MKSFLLLLCLVAQAAYAYEMEIIVDYRTSLAEKVRKAGYPVDEAVNRLWLLPDPRMKQGRETVVFQLFVHNDGSDKTAIMRMREQGYFPATLEQLLAFGSATKPMPGKKQSILALGDDRLVGDKSWGVPALLHDVDKNKQWRESLVVVHIAPATPAPHEYALGVKLK